MIIQPAHAGRTRVGTAYDPLSSASSGPFPLTRVFQVPSYFEDNLLALRHWNPPGA